MITLDLPRGHRTARVVQALGSAGWRAVLIPTNGRLERNRQIIELRTPNSRIIARFSIFAVGDRGEAHRRDERRIEITTTYQSGLQRIPEYLDVVLGYDSQNDAYVGLDPRRLEFGGAQHNASSSVDPDALANVPINAILIRPHSVRILEGIEYQAIFKPSRLSEYVFNLDVIHRGMYLGDGPFSGRISRVRNLTRAMTVADHNANGSLLVLSIAALPNRRSKPPNSSVEAYDESNWNVLADLTPEEFEAIRRRWAEIGEKGEYFAFRHEKRRLRTAGRDDLAERVDWVSRKAVGRGYDIESFETDGTPRLIEVKATSGRGMTFFMSDNEWEIATHRAEQYYIYRIIEVDDQPRIANIMRNPVHAEEEGNLVRVSTGWKISLE